MQMQVDHLVVNTRFATDLAATIFESLGFTLTPRGYHSLGSINHLMVFRDQYLELVGLPTNSLTLREEILNSPTGIDGLVLRTADAERTAQTLVARGLAAQPTQTFSRPVSIDGVEVSARFTTVRLLSGQFAAGRVYYCQHLTPDLVWREEWLSHPNGVREFAALHVVCTDPKEQAARYALLADDRDNPMERSGTPASFTLYFLSRAEFDTRFGELAKFAPQRVESFGAITFKCDDLAGIARRGRLAGLPVQIGSERATLALPEFETLLEFIT